jgi:hypothetical protein
MTDLYIPTYGRVGRQATLDAMPFSWSSRVALVARPEEADALRESTGWTVLECPVKGISATRQWIFDQHEGDKLLMFDDDLKFAIRRLDDPTKFLPLAPRSYQIADMLNLLWDALDEVHVVGLASRGGANRDTRPWRPNQRLFDVMGFRMDTVRMEGLRYRQEFMEDFDLQLQFLTRGYPTMMLNSYTKDDFGSNTSGGCSTYRDAYGQMLASLTLWENWPDFVGIRKVKAKWADIGQRYDVTVQWAKAYAEGCQRRFENGEPIIEIPDWIDETGLV